MPTTEQVVHVAALLYPSIRATGYDPKQSATQALDAAEALFNLQEQRELTRAREAEVARAALIPARSHDGPPRFAGG